MKRFNKALFVIVGLLVVIVAGLVWNWRASFLGPKNKTVVLSSPETGSFSITDKFVSDSDYKHKLMREYSLKHYGEAKDKIIPRAIIIHWTASKDMKSAYNWFKHEEYKKERGTLNVGSQFIVDRDGAIYRLMPETTFARHAIGYNWCAIGIENVGGVDHKENLTEAQLRANVKLIKYLVSKYPSIKYVWGHYQQEQAKASGLYKELIEGYYSNKRDPGPIFMNQLRANLQSRGLIFFSER